MTVSIYGGKVDVNIHSKEGGWRLSKVDEKTIRVEGRCCGTKYVEEIVGFGSGLCERLDRLAYPRELKRGERLVTIKDEKPIHLNCNFCHKINLATLGAELSRNAIRDANRRRRRDVYRGVYGGLIVVSADLRGGRFADVTRPVFLGFVCGSCGYRFSEGGVADIFTEFQHRAEGMLASEVDRVEAVAERFRFRCRCGEKLDLKLKLSGRMPKSRVEWFDLLCRYIPYSSDAFQGRLGRSGRSAYQNVWREVREQSKPTLTDSHIPEVIQDIDHAVLKDGRLLRRADILAQANQGRGIVTDRDEE